MSGLPFSFACRTATLLRCIAALAIAVTLPSPAYSAERAGPPNIVFILADDLGWTDLGCQGSKYYETPNLDRMAKEGMRFTNGYTCGPNCQPTRAALISGQYGPRTGVYTVGSTKRFDTSQRPLVPVENVAQLPLDTTTFAQRLKSGGYATALFGKWHLGQTGEHHPSKRGFDEAVTSMGRHFNFDTQPKVEYPKGTYLADWLTDHAVRFIEKNQEKPFLLCLHHFGVHSPYEAKPDLIAKFKDKPGSGGHHNPTYAAMLASVDESVGRVLAKLDELKLSDNTLVIFTSDNGGVGGYVAAGIKRKDGVTNNAPLHGGKGMLYEGGVRVPWIARWTGKVPPGTTCETPIISVDLYPTLLDLAGVKPKEGQVLDGISIKSHLLGTGASEAREAIYWHFPGYLGAGKDAWRTTPAGAIRAGDWKLIEFFETGEKNNLASKMPGKAKELHGMLVEWRKKVNAPMPAKRVK